MRVPCLAGAVLLVAGCATPYGPKGATGGYDVIPIGKDQFQIVVGGNEYTDHATLTHYLHRRAFELCGDRGYTTSNSTASTSPPLEGLDALFSDADASTVSAVIRCNPERPDPTLPETAEDGRPYCPELDREVENLRPEGYVSPEERACAPRPRPKPVEWIDPAQAATRRPVMPTPPER